MDDLTTAILAAANELRLKGWSVDDVGGDDEPPIDGDFVTTIAKYVSPLVDPAAFMRQREAKIAALRAEADALEALVAPNVALNSAGACDRPVEAGGRNES